jgi:dihydropteroate synthase
MEIKPYIVPKESEAYEIHFGDLFAKPKVIYTEDEFKKLVEELKESGKGKEALILTEQWVNIHKKFFKINYKGKFIDLGYRTAIMGILNVTPNSFYDGGKYQNIANAVKRAEKMLEYGADIIDVGGESTRPGSEPVPEEEEIKRVIPVIRELRKQLGDNFFISIDTYKSRVAEMALDEGADIVNDISGLGFDKNMVKVIAKYDCPVVINHIKGKPKNMQKKVYYSDVVAEIIDYFERRIDYALQNGVRKDRLIIDVGIGFGKYVEHNVEIIKRLREFKVLGLPQLIGISRKSFIGVILKNFMKDQGDYPPEDRLFGTLGATAYAVLNGAHIVRTHDVKETKEFLILIDTIRGYKVV